MRISDWSSDVCSSDLFSGGDEGAGGGDSRERGFSGYINPAPAPVGHGCPDCVVRPIPGGRGRACCLSSGLCLPARPDARPLVDLTSFGKAIAGAELASPSLRLRGNEIGRASCRERGGQYV